MKLCIRLYVYPPYIRNKKKMKTNIKEEKRKKKKVIFGLETILKTLLEKNNKEQQN